MPQLRHRKVLALRRIPIALWVLLFAPPAISQSYMVSYPVIQQDPRLQVNLWYQKENDNLLGAFTQDYKITVQNKTNDKLHVYINYHADLVCGQKSHSLGPLNDGYILKPGEKIDKTWSSDGVGSYVRLIFNTCPKESYRPMGTDQNGNKTYSIINSLGYNIVNIINLSEKERQKAEEEKQKKEAAEKLKKEEAEKKKKAEEENRKAEEEKKNAEQEKMKAEKEEKQVAEEKSRTEDNNDRQQPSRGQGENESYSGSSARIPERDPNFKMASQFSGGLDDIAEGKYFKDDKGNYFIKEGSGARKVNQHAYQEAKAKEQLEMMEAQRIQHEQKMERVNFVSDKMMTVVSTTFYAQQLGRDIQDATQLGTNFSSVEELNAAFRQRMAEVSNMSDELRQVNQQRMEAYTSAATVNATTGTDHAYAAALGAIGSIASSIASDNAAKKAREELAEQRRLAELAIRENERQMVVESRQMLVKLFTKGGMPLSTHKINTPVVYVFGYNIDRTHWEKDKPIPLALSNVFPVYRYKDGTFPYLSNVESTLTKGGIQNPVLIGYFTDRKEAEDYRKTLLNLGPQAKLAVEEVEIVVKEKSLAELEKSAGNFDFWGNKKSANKSGNSAEKTKKEYDYWGNEIKTPASPAKDKPKSKTDYWGNPIKD